MASTLQAFAKKRKKEETTTITARVPNGKYNSFKNYCDDLGLSINEAINLLINVELKEASKNNNIVIQDEQHDLNQVTIDDVINDELELNNDDEAKVNTKKNIEVKAKKNTTSNTEGRFTTKQYQVNGELPCPICGNWENASNFNRHAKKHATTSKDIFTNEKYIEKVSAMIEARKEQA